MAWTASGSAYVGSGRPAARRRWTASGSAHVGVRHPAPRVVSTPTRSWRASGSAHVGAAPRISQAQIHANQAQARQRTRAHYAQLKKTAIQRRSRNWRASGSAHVGADSRGVSDPVAAHAMGPDRPGLTYALMRLRYQAGRALLASRVGDTLLGFEGKQIASQLPQFRHHLPMLSVDAAMPGGAAAYTSGRHIHLGTGIARAALGHGPGGLFDKIFGHVGDIDDAAQISGARRGLVHEIAHTGQQQFPTGYQWHTPAGQRKAEGQMEGIRQSTEGGAEAYARLNSRGAFHRLGWEYNSPLAERGANRDYQAMAAAFLRRFGKSGAQRGQFSSTNLYPRRRSY